MHDEVTGSQQTDATCCGSNATRRVWATLIPIATDSTLFYHAHHGCVQAQTLEDIGHSTRAFERIHGLRSSYGLNFHLLP